MKKTMSVKPFSIRLLFGGLAFFVACGFAAVASAQTRTIRVVTYNIMCDVTQGGIGFTTPLAGLITPFSGTGTFTENSSGTVTNGGVLEGIGEEILAGNFQPIDILALQETTNNAVTVQPIVDGLNAFYSSRNITAGYARSSLQLTSTGGTGGGPNALVYNTNTVQLVASVGVGTPSGSGEPRQVGRYLFAPAGVTAGTNNEFYVYVSHYKSGTDAASLARRGVEAGIIRTNSATLPANSRVLYVGDYNVSTSTETSYQAIVHSVICPIGIEGTDPFNTNGASGIDWTAGTLLSNKTESVRSLRFRDDFQVMSSNVYYGVPGGLAYVPGTYHTFGNNGSTPSSGNVINSGNTALDGNLQPSPYISAAQCRTNLYGASDHYPVVADYTIPLGTTAPPTANFTATPTNGVAPLNVAFTDTSTGTPTSWSWTFGDTGTSTAQNPGHTYSTTGTYTVVLIASNAGGSSTNTKVNLITALTPPPVAVFTGSPTNGVAPLSVIFSDASTGNITNRFWDFGDTTTTNVTTNSVSHTYAAGTFNVTLLVSGLGGSSTNTKTGYITVVTPPPVASFTGTPTSGMEPLNVTFTDTSTGNITNRFWDFGDSNTTNTTTNSVSHTYAAGTYNVALTVTGPGGSSTSNQLNYITALTAFETWQVQYFGSTTNAAADSSADPDGDGCNNLCEFLSGTDPTNSASFLHVTSVVATGNDIVVTWVTALGHTNVVQINSGQPDGSYTTNFSDLSPLIIMDPGSGDFTTNYTDSGGATNLPARYYRIRLQP